MRPSGVRARILHEDTIGEPAAPARPRAAGFDYARLLRRARWTDAVRLDDADPAVLPPAASAIPPWQPIEPEPTPAYPADWFVMHSEGSDFVAAVARREAQATALCAAIAAHVADFCTDPAVINRGNWMLRVTLDPKLLPGCVLQMDLSFLRLVLRFEAQQAETREIVLRHVDALEANLSTLLRRHATVRDLEITVW